VIAIPAVDLREGACVQLVGGRYEAERVRIDDPLEAARSFARAGFKRLHVVDLDAATGRGSNDEAVSRLLAEPGLEIQIGGGVRSEERIRELLDRGACAVVVGTRALEDPEWLAARAADHPGRLIVAADVAGRAVVTRGWTHRLERDVVETVLLLARHPLAGVLVTAVEREGLMQGADHVLARELIDRSRLPLYLSGGIESMDELRTLSELGVHAAILGMALYTGRIEPRSLAAEFAT
jgi:phosphoribosylformimino-5-aminoimidazole carboxamide ribotide isomerase